MTDVKEGKVPYLSHFERLEQGAAGGDAWLLPIRKAAFARFSELGFPTTRHEEWRFTNVAPIAKTAFEPAGLDDGTAVAEHISRLTFGTSEAHLIRVKFSGARLVIGRGIK